MHIDGLVAVFMVYVAGNWVTFNDFALSGSMPHGNTYGSLNMYARDMVYISIYLRYKPRL